MLPAQPKTNRSPCSQRAQGTLLDDAPHRLSAGTGAIRPLDEPRSAFFDHFSDQDFEALSVLPKVMLGLQIGVCW